MNYIITKPTNKGTKFNDLWRYTQAIQGYHAGYNFCLDWRRMDIQEYYFIKILLEKLSCLVRPCELAEFLKIEEGIIFDAIEDELIPHFVHENLYALETEKLIPFLRKYYF